MQGVKANLILFPEFTCSIKQRCEGGEHNESDAVCDSALGQRSRERTVQLQPENGDGPDYYERVPVHSIVEIWETRKSYFGCNRRPACLPPRAHRVPNKDATCIFYFLLRSQY